MGVNPLITSEHTYTKSGNNVPKKPKHQETPPLRPHRYRTVETSAHPKTPLKEQHQQEEKEQQNRIFKLRYKHNDANCKNGGYDDHERSWFAVVTGLGLFVLLGVVLHIGVGLMQRYAVMGVILLNSSQKTTHQETTPLRHFQKTSTFVIGLSILIYDSDTDFIRINNQFTCIGTGWPAGCKETDWIWVGISALNPDHTADWSNHYTFV